MSVYVTLREANVARQIEWTKGQPVGMTWHGNELAGETGELIDLLLDSQRAGQHGEQDALDWLGALRAELADTVICIDLVGIAAGVPELQQPSGEADRPKPQTTDVLLAACLGSSVGSVCNILKKLEREKRGWPGSRTSFDSLHAALHHLYRFIAIIAARYGVDLRAAAREKFNATSEKVGLETRIA